MCFNNAPMPHEDLIKTAIHGFAELSEAVNHRGLRLLHQNTAISRKVVGKNVHATTRTVIWDMIKNTLFLTTVAVEPSFVGTPKSLNFSMGASLFAVAKSI